MILAYDFNEEPGGDTWTRLTRTLKDAYETAPTGEERTFSSRTPSRRIDAVFTDPQFHPTACGVPTDETLKRLYPVATDHRPQWRT